MGIKFPTPWKTLIIIFPPPRDGKGVKCPGYARGGGMLKLRFDRYQEPIILPIHKAVAHSNWRQKRNGNDPRMPFSLIYFFAPISVFYIPHNYVIPPAMLHAIPQTHSVFTFTEDKDDYLDVTMIKRELKSRNPKP